MCAAHQENLSTGNFRFEIKVCAAHRNQPTFHIQDFASLNGRFMVNIDMSANTRLICCQEGVY